MNCGLPGTSAHRTLQARVLEWVPRRPPGDLSDRGMEPTSLTSPALAGGSFTTGTTFSLPHDFLQDLASHSFPPAHSYMAPRGFEIRLGQLLPWTLFCCPEMFFPGYFLASLPNLCSFKSLLKCLLLTQTHSHSLLMFQPAPPGLFLLPCSSTAYPVLVFFFFNYIFLF